MTLPAAEVITNLGGERGIALVDLPQAIQHLGEFRGVYRLYCYFDDRCGVELQGAEYLSLKPNRNGALDKGYKVSLSHSLTHTQ